MANQQRKVVFQFELDVTTDHVTAVCDVESARQFAEQSLRTRLHNSDLHLIVVENNVLSDDRMQALFEENGNGRAVGADRGDQPGAVAST